MSSNRGQEISPVVDRFLSHRLVLIGGVRAFAVVGLNDALADVQDAQRHGNRKLHLEMEEEGKP